MPSSAGSPAYRHYRPKNLGVVRIRGKDHYLGRYGSPESWEKYHRLLAEHLSAQGPSLPHSESGNGKPAGSSINQLLVAYWRFAEAYYVRDGEPTKELACMRDALKPLRRLYGRSEAADFGPRKLKAVRDRMIDVQDLCRNEVNKRVGRIKRFFRWCVSEELIPSSIIHGLESVKGLRKGRCRARESAKVQPVPSEHVDAVFPYLPPQLTAMIEVQRLTGMRPGEVVLLRACDIDTTSQPDVWIFFPDRHKKDWLDPSRNCSSRPGPRGGTSARYWSGTHPRTLADRLRA